MMATRSLWCTRDAKNESDSTASTRLKASQPFTNPAKLFDSELCYRQDVRVEVKGLDRYQRTIADVIFARRPDSELRDRDGRFVVQAIRALVPVAGMILQSADCGRIGKGTIEKCPFAFLGRYRSPVVA